MVMPRESLVEFLSPWCLGASYAKLAVCVLHNGGAVIIAGGDREEVNAALPVAP